MKVAIVIDTNIVFSAILNTQSRIGQVILNGSKYFDFYSVGLLKEEIFRHKAKILKISKFSDSQYTKIYELVTSKIRFVDDAIIPDEILQKAILLVSDIDKDDALFVALNDYLNSYLWTGDRPLFEGLEMKEYWKIISTEKIINLYFQKKSSSSRKKK
jgi:predicted nucleic acid-binding protein